jgi:putative heme iron utilization protein
MVPFALSPALPLSITAEGPQPPAAAPYPLPAAPDAGATPTVAGWLVLHVSGLAAHTANLLQRPGVSLLVMQPEAPGAPVHALPRVTLQGRAVAPAPDSTAGLIARAAYLARFPESEPMTQLADFGFVAIGITAARQVAGFGAARTLDSATLTAVLQPAPGG